MPTTLGTCVVLAFNMKISIAVWLKCLGAEEMKPDNLILYSFIKFQVFLIFLSKSIILSENFYQTLQLFQRRKRYAAWLTFTYSIF